MGLALVNWMLADMTPQKQGKLTGFHSSPVSCYTNLLGCERHGKQSQVTPGVPAMATLDHPIASQLPKHDQIQPMSAQLPS